MRFLPADLASSRSGRKKDEHSGSSDSAPPSGRPLTPSTAAIGNHLFAAAANLPGCELLHNDLAVAGRASGGDEKAEQLARLDLYTAAPACVTPRTGHEEATAPGAAVTSAGDLRRLRPWRHRSYRVTPLPESIDLAHAPRGKAPGLGSLTHLETPTAQSVVSRLTSSSSMLAIATVYSQSGPGTMPSRSQ
uniref:Uncharacterized protein n=1 Tax=Cupriavidus pinatubonensis (strain JMP 134 / LMG 1197) TaxID=264198 RepID=Q46N10_CUPPJ